MVSNNRITGPGPILLDTAYNGTYWNDSGRFTFLYPCSDRSFCYSIAIFLNPGKYKLEAYGASGGYTNNRVTSPRNPNNPIECINEEEILSVDGNYSCPKTDSNAGAGGYASGVLTTNVGVNLFINIGGQGCYARENECLGGYNGGGAAISNVNNNFGSSGGGATDFRVREDSLFTRILVAGGGGGADNPHGYLGGQDDGTGGAGGYPGQGYFADGKYISSKEVTTLSGFSFGNGMEYHTLYESAGAGGGFFGGYADGGINAGASGGSSFALNRNIPVPKFRLQVKAGNGTVIEEGYYKLSEIGKYELNDVKFVTGANIGNGYARITVLESYPIRYIPFVCTVRSNIAFWMICINFITPIITL